MQMATELHGSLSIRVGYMDTILRHVDFIFSPIVCNYVRNIHYIGRAAEQLYGEQKIEINNEPRNNEDTPKVFCLNFWGLFTLSVGIKNNTHVQVGVSIVDCQLSISPPICVGIKSNTHVQVGGVGCDSQTLTSHPITVGIKNNTRVWVGGVECGLSIINQSSNMCGY